MCKMEAVKICAICKQSTTCNDSVVLEAKGAETVNKCGIIRGVKICVEVGSEVHIGCRKRFTDKRTLNKPQTSPSEPSFKRKCRASDKFDPKTDCLFCSTKVDFSKKHSATDEPQKVRTSEFTNSIKKCCQMRGDEWSISVLGRIEYLLSDLHAADCVYHKTCSGNFRTSRQIPQEYCCVTAESKKCGRPQNEEQKLAFLKTCTFFENNDEEQITISDLLLVMEDELQDSEESAYDRTYMKTKLYEKYGNDIIILNQEGKHDVVTLTKQAENILREYYEKPKDRDIDFQKIMLIEAASKIIKNDIKSLNNEMEGHYPSSPEVDLEKSLAYLPNSLRLLLKMLFVGAGCDLKIASIGQCIMQSVRPRKILAPLQLGLGVQMHHHYRSKFLLETLHKLGYTSSYEEVLRFERNAAVISSTNLPQTEEETSVMFIADNIDHNLCTLDGRNTIHAMGMIAAVTPGKYGSFKLPRKKVTDAEILEIGCPQLHHYKYKPEQSPMIFCEIPHIANTVTSVDILWQISFMLKPDRPNWSGIMHILHDRDDNLCINTCKSTVKYLPIIDLQPSDMTCILSTLKFLSDLGREQNVIPVITFDQPLFWKASKVIQQYVELNHICLLLGAFHTVMNLLGAIGSIMSGSGLQEILEQIYADKAVSHILSGKAYSRAVRAHLMIDASLNTLLLEKLLQNSDETSQHHWQRVAEIYDKVMTQDSNFSQCSHESLIYIYGLLKSEKLERELISRTSKLWIHYQSVIATVRKLITADRIGSFPLHIEGISESLPVFASSGHFNYTKAAYLHLQNMIKLEKTHPDIFVSFMKGGHVVRRKENKWSGIATDLLIEQSLMRSLKCTGGLTRGNGMSPVQRTIWLLSMPVCAEYNAAMQDLTVVHYDSSEQCKDTFKSRRLRDSADTIKVLDSLKLTNPFDDDPTLRNIANGVTAGDEINVDQFIAVGQKVLNEMKDKHIDFSIKRSSKVKTLGTSSLLKMPLPNTTIDSALLFQRAFVMASSSEIDLKDILHHELSAYPTSLFESPSLLRHAEKSQLLKVFPSVNVNENSATEKNKIHGQYILDGGSLIHRLNWQNGLTYEEIAKKYSSFVLSHYGSALVVFDGYKCGQSIKDNTHARRSKAVGQTVNFSAQMKFNGHKSTFLSNKMNKQRIIDLTGMHLTQQGCQVVHSNDDADLDIVMACVESAKTQTTTLIGEDTDLIILLLYWIPTPSTFNIYVRSDIKHGSQSKGTTQHDVAAIRKHFDDTSVKILLFVHAFTGCDTTSRIFSIGKQKALTTINKTEELKEKALLFCTSGLSQIEVEQIGCSVMAYLFGGSSSESLIDCRCRLFLEKVTVSKNFVKPERLPPTQSAAKYHCLRVYYQMCVWRKCCFDMDPTEWGWCLQDNKYVPKLMDLPPAPLKLLEVMYCRCTTGCSTMRCGCRNRGLPCTSACGDCQISNCDNCMLPYEDNSEEDEL